MFHEKLEPGDRAVFSNESPEYAGRTGKSCTVRTVDTHTSVVAFDDGYRMCVYPGELSPLPRPVRKHPGLAMPYGPTHDEGSLA